MKITCCGQVRGLFLIKEILLGSLAKLERSWAEYLITEGDFTLLKSYCSSAKELSHGAVSCREGHVQETDQCSLMSEGATPLHTGTQSPMTFSPEPA